MIKVFARYFSHLPSSTYWKSLQDVLIQYIRHNDNKFEYVNGIAHRKHIIAYRIRYIGKESNNLDKVSVLGTDEDSYLEYENLEEFYDWTLSLKPKEVKDKGISQQALYKIKTKIKSGKHLNPRVKVVKILLTLFKKQQMLGKSKPCKHLLLNP